MTPVRGPGPWAVVNLVAQIALGLLVMTLPLPSMAEWPVTFGRSQSAVQLTFSGYVAAFGLLQLLYGPLSDRVGRRNVLLVGLALVVAGSLLAAAAADLPQLVAARVLQGMGTAAGAVAGRASVQDLFSGAQRTRVMAYVGMALGLCPPTGTLLGGWLHVHFGWQSNFVLMAALALVLVLLAWRTMPASTTSATSAGAWLPAMVASYARLARERVFLLYVALLSLTVAAFYAFLAGAPLVLHGYGVAPQHMGLYIMTVPISYIVGNFATSRLAQRLGEERLMAAGQLSTLCGLSLVALLAALQWRTPLAFSLPLLLLGLGHGLLTPVVLSRTVGVIPALAGSAAAVAGLAQQGVGAAAGYAVGWLRHDGPLQLATLMIACTLAATVAQWRLARRPA